MAKILAITPETISISMENDVIKDVPVNLLNFVPQIGDAVEVSVSVNNIVVMKTDNKDTEQSAAQSAAITDTDDTNTGTGINTETNTKEKKKKRKWTTVVEFIFLIFGSVYMISEGKIIWSVLFVILTVDTGLKVYQNLKKPLTKDTKE